MKNQRHYSALLVAVLLLIGCTKKEELRPSSELLLTTWQTQEISQIIDGQSLLVYQKGKQTNSINYAKARLTFKADGTYAEVTTGGNTYDGTWQLTESNQKLVLDGGEVYTINQLSTTVLDISKTFVGVVSKKTVLQQEKWIPL